MKKLLIFLLITTLFFAVIAKLQPRAKDYTEQDTTNEPKNDEFIKAIWLSQFDMAAVYAKNGKQREINEYTTLATQISQNIYELGFNTVIVQVRPNGDSIYPSKIFPASRYAVGSYCNSFSYDPFIIFLESAKSYGLSVHAWINPLRCMTESEANEICTDNIISSLLSDGKCLKLVDGRYYLDPAYEESRKAICDGVKEIIQTYKIEGIHIDDYFYPTKKASFDAESFDNYIKSGGKSELSDFRRNNVNLLIKDIYQTVKSENKDLLFGVSPSGNIKRNYDELYADTALWCSKKGYIDYICPQIYFGFEHSTHPFEKVCEDFSEMCANGGVDLIIGITLEKAALATEKKEDIYAGNGSDEWINNKNLIARMLGCIRTIDNCGGIAIFSYQHFYNAETNDENLKTEQERNNFLPIFKNIN